MKNYLIAFLIATLVISTSGVLLLMLMMPQTTVDVNASLEKYENIDKEDFKFENSRNITNDRNEKIYEITEDNLASFKKKYMYRPGNVNPFSSEIDIYNESIKNNQNNENSNDKTDNSNDGKGNSSNTGK